MARTSTSWKAGVSGNPGGRPRKHIDVEILAQAHAPQAIQTLVRALDNPRLCVAAATALLDRGFGRPKQQISGDANKPLVVDFKWADGGTVVPAAVQQTVISGVAEQIGWDGDDGS
jgi:hypothetical protein